MLDRFYRQRRGPAAGGPGRARHDLLPGPDPRLDRRARGDARPGEAARSPASTRTGSTRRSSRIGLLQSDPTVFYVHDTLELAEDRPSTTGRSTRSGRRSRAASPTRRLPADLAGYNTYTSKGLPPGPICTPTLASIDAALEPDTKDDYLFFLAKDDGSERHAFAKTLKRAPGERQEVRQARRREPAGRRAAGRTPRTSRRRRRPPIAPAGPRPTGPRGRPGSPACGPGSRRPASTPTSACAASTCAT